MLVSMQTIVDTAIDLADMRNSKFIDTSGTPGTELIRYCNIAYKDLYNQIVLANERHFVSTSTISVTSATDTYALPSDFYKLLGVDLQVTATQSITLDPFMFSERNKYRNGIFFPNVSTGYTLKYLLSGTNIKFVPVPINTATVVMWYVPSPTTIVSFSDIMEVVIGGDEYMSLYIALMMREKEESDGGQLVNKMQTVLQQLLNTVRSRDQGSPSYVVDETSKNMGAVFPWFGSNT